LWTQVKYESIYHRSGYFVVDCVVGVDERPVCVVEFKREGRTKPKPWSRQGKAYANIDLPVIFCLGATGLEAAINEAEDFFIYGEQQQICGWIGRETKILRT